MTTFSQRVTKNSAQKKIFFPEKYLATWDRNCASVARKNFHIYYFCGETMLVATNPFR